MHVSHVFDVRISFWFCSIFNFQFDCRLLFMHIKVAIKLWKIPRSSTQFIEICSNSNKNQHQNQYQIEPDAHTHTSTMGYKEQNIHRVKGFNLFLFDEKCYFDEHEKENMQSKFQYKICYWLKAKRDWSKWIETEKRGKREREKEYNHSTCWALLSIYKNTLSNSLQELNTTQEFYFKLISSTLNICPWWRTMRTTREI